MRRSRPLRSLVLALAAGAMALSGCSPEEQAMAQQMIPALAMALASASQGQGPGAQVPGLSAFPNASATPASFNPASPLAGLGPAVPNRPAGLPGFDTSRPPASTGGEIEQLLEQAAARYQIPPDLLKAVAWQESRWDPNARSFDGGHGKGVMQIDDRFHDFANTPAVFDPAQNIDYGARFLREKYDQEGNWTDALERYNGGSDYPPIVLAHMGNRPWLSEPPAGRMA